jgi:NCS1 family nucleobase:cation symporter-1
MQKKDAADPVPVDPAAPDANTEVLHLERHGIDFIPLSERHGRPADLFTLWFGANAMAVTMATGAIAATTGMDLIWGSIAIVIGAAVGTIFMAYHSAQGPQLGLPQMIQSRAQFGFFGANLPMIIVIAMYLGFYAGGAILGARALNVLFGWSIELGVALVTTLSLLLVLFGYNMMHLVGRIITPFYIVVFALLSVSLVGHWRSFPTTGAAFHAHFLPKPFFMIVSIAAAYYIAYGPYVADYSRYLPVRTSTAQTFWYTYAGSIASAIWIMVLGAGIQTAVGGDNVITGAAEVAGGTGAWLRVVTLVALVLGLANINALNIYGAMMSSLTIVTSVFRQLTVRPLQRTAFIVGLSAAGGLIAGATSSDFVHAYENFILHHHVSDSLVGNQPGRLLLDPPGPLRRRGIVHSGWALRQVQRRRAWHLYAGLPVPDSVHQRGVLHRPDRQAARLRCRVGRRPDRSGRRLLSADARQARRSEIGAGTRRDRGRMTSTYG